MQLIVFYFVLKKYALPHKEMALRIFVLEIGRGEDIPEILGTICELLKFCLFKR